MKIIECPRDAMQGLENFIPTHEKVEYLNQLLKVGFDTIDCGSFVSAKAMPQMRDTSEVIPKLKMTDTGSKLLVIVANRRGAEEAVAFDEITYLGYPISISETFQQRNTNRSIGESFSILQEIQELCIKNNKTLVAYISMGFGNPYGDPYNEDIVLKFTDILTTLQIKIISLSDTIGVSTVESILRLYSSLSTEFGNIELGCHLHSHPRSAAEKVEAAYLAGCRRFDGAIKGFGGCPMADEELVGNIATENIIKVIRQFEEGVNLDMDQFQKSLIHSSRIFE